MGILKKIFGFNNSEEDEYITERNPYGDEHFNYPFSQKVTSFILKLIDKGERIYNYYPSQVVVVMDEFHYAMWNNNHPYAWLSKCYRYWQVPVIKERKIETNLWLPNPYEKVTTYEWKNTLLWDKLLPEPWAMWKFEKWCLKNGITVGTNEQDHQSNMDTEFMDKILSSSNNKKEGE